MARTTLTVFIQRPPGEVFDFVSNARNDPAWNPDTIECVPDREPGVGEQRRAVFRMMGRKRQGTAEVTEFEPGRKVTVRTTSGIPMTLLATLECEPLGEGTKVVAVFHMDLPLLLKPLSPLLAVMMRRQLQQNLLLLKQVLESPER
jgi:uncharacterized protein YndB with AHSA1/START domain